MIYDILDHIDHDEMLKLIATVGNVDDSKSITLDITHTEGEESGYSVIALVWENNECVDTFYPGLIYETPYIPYMMSHVIRAELECKGLGIIDGLFTTAFDKDFKEKDYTAVDKELHEDLTYAGLCEKLRFNPDPVVLH